MRIKQYLRGLGIGMLVTAMICGISDAVRSKRPMTDAEIKARARELGMVDEKEILIQTPSSSPEKASAVSAGSAGK